MLARLGTSPDSLGLSSLRGEGPRFWFFILDKPITALLMEKWKWCAVLVSGFKESVTSISLGNLAIGI